MNARKKAFKASEVRAYDPYNKHWLETQNTGGVQDGSSEPRTSPSTYTMASENYTTASETYSPEIREFPSLSGAPQSQQPNTPSQAIWGSSGLRAPLNSQNRPLSQSTQISDPSHTIRPPSHVSHTQPHRSLEGQEDSRTSPFPQLGGSIDEFGLSNNTSPRDLRENDRQSAGDDFPPLSGGGSRGLGQLRRAGFGQEMHLNGTTNGNIESPSQLRSSGSRQQEAQSASNDASPVSRSVLDGLNGESEIMAGADQSIDDRLSSSQGRIPLGGRPNGNAQHDQFGRPSHVSSGANPGNGTEVQLSEQMASISMSDVDRYGIRGLQAILDGVYGPDQAALAHGMDLNMLGLDLNRNSPLYTDWAGPFADANGRLVIPEFTLPPAYTVNNVPPLHEKIGSFSDETLFMIFYQNPGDESQELAANELYQRDWRWHKKLQQWMMKAKEFGEPVISQSRQEERGLYYFWNAIEWRRERREFILSYEHLHHVQPMTQNAQ